jgi:hypothetical protein
MLRRHSISEEILGDAMIVYKWPKFTLKCCYNSGDVTTTYDDGHWSGCKPVKDDEFHAKRLGISDKEHRLVHELSHHLIGFAYYKQETGSPVIYRSAHNIEQSEPDSELEEWMVTALTYHIYQKNYDYGAISYLYNVFEDVELIANRLKAYMAMYKAKYNCCIDIFEDVMSQERIQIGDKGG